MSETRQTRVEIDHGKRLGGWGWTRGRNHYKKKPQKLWNGGYEVRRTQTNLIFFLRFDELRTSWLKFAEPYDIAHRYSRVYPSQTRKRVTSRYSWTNSPTQQNSANSPRLDTYSVRLTQDSTHTRTFTKKNQIRLGLTSPLEICAHWETFLLSHIHLQLGYHDAAYRLVSFSIPSYFSHGILAWIFTTSAIPEPCSSDFPCQD